MRVHWTEVALAHLEGVRAAIARHSDRYARSMVSRIFERTAMLGDHPNLGPVVPEFDDAALRELFEHPYRIVYRVNPEQVDVLAVVHAARRLPRNLLSSGS